MDACLVVLHTTIFNHITQIKGKVLQSSNETMETVNTPV